MAVAILAALGAAVALIVVIAVTLVVRNRKNTSYAGQKKEVSQLSTVGVGSSLLDDKARANSSANEVRVGSDRDPSKKPVDTLKSRFVALGVFAAAVFGTLAAKLWSMQILASSTYAEEAEENLYTTVSKPAPRGFICDTDGVTLVKNRTSLTVLSEPSASDDYDTVVRLSAVLGVPTNVIRARMQDTSAGAQSQRVVASDARMRDAAFISEHADAFPGIMVETRTVRDYPFGALAAHALGYVGTVFAEQLESAPENRVLEATDDVGKSGLEYIYDNLLAGDHGQQRVIVDAKGNVIEVVSETKAVKGSDVYLTLRGPVQYACDRVLAELVAPKDGAIGSGKGVGAAVVAMDVRDGGIIAMASYPTYDPSTFVGGIPTDVWDLYQTEEAHNPLLNRAVDGTYAAASTFKAFSGLAGLEYGFADTTKTWDCAGWWDGFGTGSAQLCWYHAGHGTLDFRGGIVNSCDVVFYEIAKNFWDACSLSGNENPTVSDTALQDSIKKFRFGEKTFIDLPSEETGTVPTPETKAERWRNVPSEATWQGGDLTNLIIGQGDVLVTPLQIAVAYGGIATGKIMKPHLLKEVRNESGDVVLSFSPEIISTPDVKATHLTLVRDALHGVAQDNSGIASLFAQYGIDAAAKTGTAEHTDKGDDAWFVCYAPFDDPKYVVACVVEQGGGGSAVAAPIGTQIMGAIMAGDAGTLDPIMGRIAGSTGKQVEKLDTTIKSGRTD